MGRQITKLTTVHNAMIDVLIANPRITKMNWPRSSG